MHFEATLIHEAGHALIWQLEEKHLGPMSLVTVIPSAHATGRVRGEKEAFGPLTLGRLRASGRMNAAGILAEELAGLNPPPQAAAKDARNLATLERLSKRGPRFTVESLAGAELLLRMHWAGVEKLASWLRTAGELTPPYGIELVRMALEEPPRPLVPDIDTFERLCRDIEGVPELADPLAAALGSASQFSSDGRRCPRT